MRKSGTWQCALDDRILEVLRTEGLSPPELISREITANVSPRRVRERCRVLAHAGLASPIVDEENAEFFEITGWGELYLDGKVNASLMQPLPRPRPPDKVRPRFWTSLV
ncbi:repressor phrH2 [Haloferax sp. Atlit-47N]|nr:repressor phrH2 [Haloferax sp. Atlit-47N]RDZ35553.1 repressor phrH2 [Haloferax sp. Atlit-24N]RLM36349.1 repressor phrH2 [Haloferax sp. Atlit-109R]RLM43816.1 repressor phrH2 [Haloferax sp. Atlit-105R]RDZ35554.1 repressor phrH2 [Haloferax sp. Atlit-24N]